MRQLKIIKSITNRENASLDKYLQEIGHEELISAEEEVELAHRIKNGDRKALEKLTKANLRFVVSVAKQYQNQGLSLPDLINEGNIGLLKAAEKFDETRGFKFISYAVWWTEHPAGNSRAESRGTIATQSGGQREQDKAHTQPVRAGERTPTEHRRDCRANRHAAREDRGRAEGRYTPGKRRRTDDRRRRSKYARLYAERLRTIDRQRTRDGIDARRDCTRPVGSQRTRTQCGGSLLRHQSARMHNGRDWQQIRTHTRTCTPNQREGDTQTETEYKEQAAQGLSWQITITQRKK